MTGFGVQWSSRAHCLLMNSVTENEVHKCDAALELSQVDVWKEKERHPRAKSQHCMDGGLLSDCFVSGLQTMPEGIET